MSSRGVLATVAIVQFMVSLDLSVMNVGLPSIQEALGFRPATLSWVIHAYALTFGGLLLLGGGLADRFGRRRMLLVGLGIFALASLGGGFAPVAPVLVGARALQGVGAAILAPAALALLTSTFPGGPERIRAFGVWSAMNALGGAVGVLAGGLLTEVGGWQWVMWISVPMAAAAIALATRSITPDLARSGGRPDVLGAVLATSGMVLLVFGVVRTEGGAWTAPPTVGALVGALVLLALFLRVEQTTARRPLLRLGLLANRAVAGANLVNLLVGAAMAAAFYFVSLYLQHGLEFLPFALGVVAGSVLAARWGRRLPAKGLIVLGTLTTGIGFAWFATMEADGSFLASVLGPSILASVGFGLCLGPVVSTATVGVEPGESGTASALLNSSRQGQRRCTASATRQRQRRWPMATVLPSRCRPDSCSRLR
jgi:MFS family permease